MCARLSGSHSAFESTLSSSIVSYRIPDEEIEKCGFGIFEDFLLAASHYEYINSCGHWYLWRSPRYAIHKGHSYKGLITPKGTQNPDIFCLSCQMLKMSIIQPNCCFKLTVWICPPAPLSTGRVDGCDGKWPSQQALLWRDMILVLLQFFFTTLFRLIVMSQRNVASHTELLCACFKTGHYVEGPRD